MGTTAQKLQRVLDTKEGLKDTINTYLGQDITSAIPFKDYETYIKNFYGSLPKTDYAEGSNITLSNTLKGKLDFENDIVWYGQTEQKSYEGYNLLQAKLNTITNNGITVTNNRDGSFTINGTNTSSSLTTFRIDQSTQNGVDNLQNYEDGTYTLDLGIQNENIQITLMQVNTWQQFIATGMNTRLKSGTITDATDMFIYIAIKGNATVINVTIKPMFLKGSYTTSTIPSFEPYVGGTVSPNSFYPQDIEVVRGKNRFNGELYNGQVGSNDGYSASTNRITNISGANDVGITKLAKGTYTISIANLDYCALLTKNSSGTILDNYANEWHSLPYTFTLTQDGYISFTARKSDNSNISPSDYNIMLEKGSQATSYLPYNTLEVVERGKNLVEYKMATTEQFGVTVTNNNNGTFTISGSNTRGSVVGFRIDQSTYVGTDNLKDYANGTYTIDLGITNSNIRAILMQQDTYIPLLSANYGTRLNSGTLTNATDMFFLIQVKEDASFSTPVTIKPMLVKGSYTVETIGNFEPYITPQTYQLSLGEYEFAKIGNYVDTIEYDVDEDKVYKNENIGNKTLIGAETEYWAYSSGWSKTNTNVFYMSSVTPNALFDDYDEIYGLCNRFIVSSRNNVNSADTNLMCYSGGIDLPQLTIRIDKTIANDLTAFIQWLSNNNLKYYYILATPTLTEITGTLADQIKALYYSHSFTGTTIIEINGQLPLIIKVRALKGE